MPIYECDICGQPSSTATALYQHVRDVHNGGRRIPTLLQCNICGRNFAYVDALDVHMRHFHDPEIPHPCPACGLRYANPNQLLEHMEWLHGDAIAEETYESIRRAIQHAEPPNGITASGPATDTESNPNPRPDPRRDYDNECPVCLESLTDKETKVTPCCNQELHMACLRRIDHTHGFLAFPCPLCRRWISHYWLIQ